MKFYCHRMVDPFAFTPRVGISSKVPKQEEFPPVVSDIKSDDIICEFNIEKIQDLYNMGYIEEFKKFLMETLSKAEIPPTYGDI